MVIHVTIKITKDSGNQWEAFFTENEHVSHVIWEGTSSGWDDITVYFNDSDEPFPITGLRMDSPVKQGIYKICGE